MRKYYRYCDNSHYTWAFLEYAWEHNIHMLCYPAHSTHVYQGLNVAVFSVLKRFWSEERDRWEREHGEKISKENFLAVYGAAHIWALTPEIISATFQKTGVWPYDPSVVTAAIMAPSLETLSEVTLPLIPPTPVCIVMKLIRDASWPVEVVKSDSVSDAIASGSGNGTSASTTHSPVKAALTALDLPLLALLSAHQIFSQDLTYQLLPLPQLHQNKNRGLNIPSYWMPNPKWNTRSFYR